MMKINRLKLLSLAGLLILIWVNFSFGQTASRSIDRPALKKKLQAKLDQWHESGKFPGATFGYCLAAGDCYGLATGFSDLETRKPMRPTDIMAAGSVGKTFAAAIALQLVKEGKIGLDERAEKYLGGEAWFGRLPNAKNITVRQLMNHTSGLVRYEFKEQFTRDLTARPDKNWKPEELLAYLFDEKAPFDAGQGWDYSDTNYIVLGIIIERVSGKKYYDLAQNRILKPHKLTRTSPQDRRELDGLIQGYAGEKNPFGGKDRVLENGRFIINPQFEWTGGGMISNAGDLARWAKLMYEGKAFDPALLAQMLDGVPAKLGRDAKYGLGVIIRPTQFGLSYGHSGFFPGYVTDMAYFPEHKISLAVQVNTSVAQNLGKPLSRVLIEMAETILGREPGASEPERKAEKKQFIIILRLEPRFQNEKNWTEADNKAVQNHFEKLQKLQKEDKIIFAGRTLIKESMGVVILEVETEAEARRVIDEDDAVRAAIMSAEILPFRTALMK